MADTDEITAKAKAEAKKSKIVGTIKVVTSFVAGTIFGWSLNEASHRSLDGTVYEVEDDAEAEEADEADE